MPDAQIPGWRDVPGLVHGFGRRDSPPPTRGRLFLLKQVHGTGLATPPWKSSPEADASATSAPGLLLGIKTADCLPLLFVDRDRRLAAAAHAGWRGTAAGIVGRVLDWFAAQGGRLDDVQVALGPCIGPCCYEVGEELRSQFADAEQRFFTGAAPGKPHLDLRGLNEQQLLTRGVAPHQIAHVAECTRCQPSLYYSYRREGAGTGRLVSYVGWE